MYYICIYTYHMSAQKCICVLYVCSMIVRCATCLHHRLGAVRVSMEHSSLECVTLYPLVFPLHTAARTKCRHRVNAKTFLRSLKFIHIIYHIPYVFYSYSEYFFLPAIPAHREATVFNRIGSTLITLRHIYSIYIYL